MIPLRLVLKDFLSYGDPAPIDFTGFDVACLTGDNGVGKSAFLDAISWALFGAARGCENGLNQDRLIRDGADETFVDFTFALGDATYRIVRKRSKTKGEVRFMIADGDDWTNIAGETMRDTEARITSTLRMDYDTFTASAFFVQGHAEDFLARMKADRRKEIFASLLDLGVYEQLEDAARTRARDAEKRRVDAAELIEHLTSTSEDATLVRAELAQATTEAAECSVRAKEAEDEVTALRDVVGSLAALRAEADGERKLIANLEAAARRADELLAAKRQEIIALDDLLARTDEVRTAHDELRRLREQDEALRAKEREAAKLREREAELRTEIKAAHDALRRRIADGTRDVASLAKERAQLEHAEGDLVKATTALDDVKDAPAALDDARRQIDAFRSDEARIAEAIRNLDTRAVEIDEHTKILAAGGGECPVCGTALDAAHRKQAAKRLGADLRAISTERTKLSGELDVARKEAKRTAEDVARLAKADAERQRLAKAVGTLRARLERLPIVVADAERLQAEVDEAARRIADGVVAPELEMELSAVSERRAGLYDAAAHAGLSERIEELRPAEQLWIRITQSTEQRPALKRAIAEAEEHGAELVSQMTEHRSALASLEARLTELPEATERLRGADDALKAANTAAQAAAVDVARLEERLAVAEGTAKDLADARAAELSAATDARRFGRLVKAFGPGGIPALVMDNVLPDLTEEANDILGELSNYEMYVQFDLKRPTKSGKERDTFDVRVHHSGGEPRDFAMFSGGEAFRIAFAVRLAMSKLLVRRAGAQLETLVIDEGFGTQDPEGRERLITAIKLAQREFRKVLVITHLDDLKDAFATQIRVTKDDRRGSVLEVVEA